MCEVGKIFRIEFGEGIEKQDRQMDKDIKPQNILQTISLEEMCVFNYDCVEFRLFVQIVSD